MLDNGTKRRIDTARDILVGKIPDPKSQVEQITIALIYKFMDDMDAESEELGGSRNFFAGEFARYGWAKLMRSGLGGHETLNLYAEAIARMPENPGIPLLFRNIFKNAYLPYRDPETLRAFLKVIDEFTYDHSERLGDAFEYLLSVLGSQGDAGQFRTPRHIIDFIVAIVDPKKHETILDPACGTAGFLISSYKHILKNNLDENGYSTLTPDDKGRMVENFSGYDISPDMVRLSLVNMYLHGFSDPQIFEYDTLTSQERWNEYADVILANPPFMSPKGGIRPHNRFSVQSKRSEVLFVDYIADHLTPEGRAGVIVPEGIIFQSQNAYKQLRKKLLEESLVAVVSLPAGVFQPYSGVKTSILVLDKALAKKADTIAFFKIENDGFGLGAQRRPIDKNDLPQMLEEVKGYFDYLRVADGSEEYLTQKGLVVKREKIAANGEYNLSGERYREIVKTTSGYPQVRLDTVAEIAAGNSAPQGDEYFKDGIYSFIRTADVGKVHLSDCLINSSDKVNDRAIAEYKLRLFPVGTILFPKSGASTFLNHRAVLGIKAYVSSHLACIICNEEKALPKYVYSLLRQIDARDITPDQAYPSLRLSQIGAIKIPLPPLEIQNEIVTEIESYQKVIDGARAVVENYRPHIPKNPSWKMVMIGDVCDLIGGSTPSRQEPSYWENGSIKWISSKHINEFGQIIGHELITEKAVKDNATKIAPESSIIIITRVSVGKYAFANDNYAINQDLTALVPNRSLLLPKFFYFVAPSIAKIVEQKAEGIGVRGVTRSLLSQIQIPLPPLEVQGKIAAEIEAEQTIVNANRELIECFEKKIEKTINRVWSET